MCTANIGLEGVGIPHCALDCIWHQARRKSNNRRMIFDFFKKADKQILSLLTVLHNGFHNPCFPGSFVFVQRFAVSIQLA